MNTVIHFDDGVSDVFLCGRSGPKLYKTKDPNDTSCKSCLKRLKNIDGEWCLLVTFVDTCSGCFEGGDYMGLAHNYPIDEKNQIRLGMGCLECGYHGKVRRSELVPLFNFSKPDHAEGGE